MSLFQNYGSDSDTENCDSEFPTPNSHSGTLVPSRPAWMDNHDSDSDYNENTSTKSMLISHSDSNSLPNPFALLAQAQVKHVDKSEERRIAEKRYQYNLFNTSS